MDRAAAGNALKNKTFRRGTMLKRETLLKMRPGDIVYVCVLKVGEKNMEFSAPMVLNSVDAKVATFLHPDQHAKFVVSDPKGKQHAEDCWSIFEGYDIRLYAAELLS